jgi:heme/copper-type cytochrome/quinol oxidase subunit 1
LPAFGVVSHVISKFSQKKNFWLWRDGYCYDFYRFFRFFSLGSSYVYSRFGYGY